MSLSVDVLHTFEDEAGISHFRDEAIARKTVTFAPPAPPFFVSDVEPAKGFVVISIPSGWIGEPHPSPHRQILFCRGGALKVTAGDGSVRVVGPGDVWLMSDNTGGGHASEVVSKDAFEAVIIMLGR